jgi:hypothetical protein
MKASQELNRGLTKAQMEAFHRDGYLMISDVFQPEELEPLRQEIAALVDAAARKFAAEGRITNLHENEGFETRLTRLIADHPEMSNDYLRFIWGKGGGGHAGPEIFQIITHPKLLDMMESLLGPEIVGSSAYRIRPKVPGLERTVVPWHQDSGYFAPHCDKALIITCWLPLVDATVENGCLYVLPRAHRKGIVRHYKGGPGGYLVILDQDLPAPLEEAIPVPVPKGGVLLMTNLTPHCSVQHTTDIIRWSIDLRYQSREAPTNAEQTPEQFDLNAPDEERACYPPEGDFIVRSARSPEAVHTYEQFVARRAMYEAATLPGPNRGWQPIGS